MSDMQKKANLNLQEGMDSGDPPPSTKLYVALNSGGKCCVPSCENHLTQTNTKVTECAHIIPRRVGFVREDWTTPLEDRKKKNNLIYVCSIHHKIIDNPENEKEYPASKLFAWKKEHEERIKNGNKPASQFPASFQKRFQETMETLDRELADQSQLTRQLLLRLLADCKLLLRKRYLDKAEVLLAHTEALLVDFSDSDLDSELKALLADLLWRKGEIQTAKVSYLSLLNSTHHIDGMIDYIELCSAVPEQGDKATEYEELAIKIDPENPRLKLLALNRQFQKQEPLSAEITEEKWSGDDHVNCQFYAIYSLFLDLAEDMERRDYFVDQWEVLLPESPRPIIFRILFLTLDAFRRGIKNRDEALALLKEVQSHEDGIDSDGKDPLSTQDQISLLIEKIKICNAVLHFSGGDPELLGELRDKLFGIVNQRYFDKQLNQSLPEVLSAVLIDLPQWNGLIAIVQASKVVPSRDVIDLIVLQGINLNLDFSELRRFASHYSRDDLTSLLDAIEQKNVAAILDALADKEMRFTLLLIQSLRDTVLRAEVILNIQFPEDHGIDALFFQIGAYARVGNKKKALELAKQVDLQKITPSFLQLICNVSYQFRDHKLTIDSGKRLLESELPSDEKIQLHGELATSYAHSDDDRNAIKHATEALRQTEHLGDDNTRSLIILTVNSLLTLDRNDEAAGFVASHTEKIQLMPELGILFADTVLKSSLDEKAEIALDYITSAFKHAPSEDENLYLSAVLVLNELDKLGVIGAEKKNDVCDGTFVKIDGIDAWFYAGSANEAYGATPLNQSDPRYQSMVGKSLGDEVEWPADKYSSPNEVKKVAHILDRNTYFCVKAHEIMQTMAERGHKAIWKINVLDDDGSFNKTNLLKFHQEEFRRQNEFFQAYCDQALPFSMLCSVEGSLHQALSKIRAENKGFVRCNNGNSQQMQQHYRVANQIVDGSPFFIDCLSALMLLEAGLLEAVIDKLPNIHVTSSTIKPFRDLAEALRPSSSPGRLGFAGGRLQLTERDAASEAKFRQKVIGAAELLDSLPNKIIGQNYEDQEADEPCLDAILPNWIVDTVRLAKENECAVLTDDALALQAYSIEGDNVPASSASISLVRCLSDRGIIGWEDYLKYFGRLSSYRYFLLPISEEEMEYTVLPMSNSGLILFKPNDIDYLNLSLTLSKEYGVDDNLAIRIAAGFFKRILVRNDVTESMADEIFPRVLIGVLSGRTARLHGKILINLCRKLLDDNPFSSALSYRKLALLEQQVSRYAKEFNPLFQGVPSLLKTGTFALN